jgi:hypothetical protein
LAHVQGVLGCDLERASKAFDSMRNHRSRVLVFDGVDKTWHGCYWTPPEEESRDRKIWREMMALHRDFAVLRAEFRKLKKKVSGQRGKEREKRGENPDPAPDREDSFDVALKKSREASSAKGELSGSRLWAGCCDGCGFPEVVGTEPNLRCGGCNLPYCGVAA